MKKTYESQFEVEKHLNGVPRVWDAPGYSQPGVKAVFYEGAPYQGHETRCFAWIGIPAGASSRKKVPGIVLVHGGGGTAHADWVRVWTERGYAAIAMDTCGGAPCWNANPFHYAGGWPRHEFSGAPGWGGFDQVEQPLADQWTYQATAAVLRATALLRSFPEVDADRLGITGISWGGFLTIVAAAVAPRGTYRYGMPVYASAGFAERSDSSLALLPGISREMYDKWNKIWDPKRGLKSIDIPMLFISDAEDEAFPLPTWQTTTDAVSGPVQRSLRIDYPHDHTISVPSATEKVFADSILRHRKLPVWGRANVEDGRLVCPFDYSGHYILETKMHVTRGGGYWADRKWRTVPAELKDGILSAPLPYGATAAFFQVRDEASCRWSSEVCIL